MEDALKSFQISDLTKLIPEAILPIFITLALSFLIGLEREEHNLDRKNYNFGGVRTFPIIGLCGYMMSALNEAHQGLLVAGALILGAFLFLSYRKKLELSSTAGLTSELSGLFTYLLGALLFHHDLWESTTLAVIVLLLLELKTGLEALARKISVAEIFTFTKFLLISAVILPIVPDRNFTGLHLNPYHTWLIVVAISGLSYAAYAVSRLLGPNRGIIIAALLGGLYSSTSTTIVLAKRSATAPSGHLYTGGIVIASALMYFRLIVLLCIFNLPLGMTLLLPFALLGSLFLFVGFTWIHLGPKKVESTSIEPQLEAKNPLELQSALIFALAFSVMGVLTALALQYLGSIGIYGLSFLTGLTDVDPFVMSITQSAGQLLNLQTAAHGIIIATASNNVMKGVYAASWGGESVRKQSLLLLVALAVVSLLTLFFV